MTDRKEEMYYEKKKSVEYVSVCRTDVQYVTDGLRQQCGKQQCRDRNICGK